MSSFDAEAFVGGEKYELSGSSERFDEFTKVLDKLFEKYNGSGSVHVNFTVAGDRYINWSMYVSESVSAEVDEKVDELFSQEWSE